MAIWMSSYSCIPALRNMRRVASFAFGTCGNKIVALQDDAIREPALYSIGRFNLQAGGLQGIAVLPDWGLQD